MKDKSTYTKNIINYEKNVNILLYYIILKYYIHII